MKTILVLDNIFSSDMILDFDYLKKNLDMKKYNFISPLMFFPSEENNPYETKDFPIKLLASTLALCSSYKELNEAALELKEQKPIVYFGPANTNISPQNIYTVKPAVLDAQEFLLDKYINQAGVKFDYIKSSAATKTFQTINELVEFLNDL
jgi:hypothetical protein